MTLFEFIKQSKEDSNLFFRLEPGVILNLLEEAIEKFKTAHQALQELQFKNQIRNDFEAYLWEVQTWGLGNGEKPEPKNFGVE